MLTSIWYPTPCSLQGDGLGRWYGGQSEAASSVPPQRQLCLLCVPEQGWGAETLGFPPGGLRTHLFLRIKA